ncbi:MAG: sigma-54-dependent Fis family transcriptional regulator [Candidatus Eiseniibacteriota bacterium]|nr:MAG: sigma-54-dependent Fis family transcriptional regulator [Candidatus Eisenbacteria bacterium]
MDELKVLVIDDEQAIRDTCSRVLRKLGFSPLPASSGKMAVRLVGEHDVGLAILDIKMPGMDGIETLTELKKLRPDTRVIIITAHGTIENAIQAMRCGASDYLLKPFSIVQLEESIRRAFGAILKRADLAEMDAEFCGLVGKSPVMLGLRRMIELVSSSDVTALIMGETGTGKELVARAIHQLSDRADEPFVPIDCSAIGEHIVESELFGHKKGSFTDAHADRVGLLQAAGRGTVFLDEITNIPVHIQAKLLRALQEKEIRPIGAVQSVPLKARVLAASNADIVGAIKTGQFREDLFYRLHVVPIHVPSLASRKEDIPLLVEHFLVKHRGSGELTRTFEDAAVRALSSQEWPGNVRQLESFVRMVMTVVRSQKITEETVVRLLDEMGRLGRPGEERAMSLEEAEKQAILRALSSVGGDKRKAAQILGIALSTLYRKMNKLGIEE